MMFFSKRRVECDQISDDFITAAGVELHIARFDKIHPVISGNKIYKLHYFLKQAVEEKKPIVTFGGPFSNHLSAAAYASGLLNIPCMGIINGQHHSPTHTLLQCEENGMSLKFVSPHDYREMKTRTENEMFPGTVIIPEGGYHPVGAKGAALMADDLPELTATHICISVGTATTLAGFLSSSEKEIIAVPAIKNMTDIPERLNYLETSYEPNKLHIWNEYHFGGFAKATPALFEFMNNFHNRYGVELDRVYTAKMMWGVFENIRGGFFRPGSSIICIHTGGLQGNG